MNKKESKNKFTCLKCLSDPNLGPGNSSSFALSHRKPWTCSLSDWCRSDLETPSAPSQQLISSSCSFITRKWHKHRNGYEQKTNQGSGIRENGEFWWEVLQRVILYRTQYIASDVSLYFQIKRSSVQAPFLSMIHFKTNTKRLLLTCNNTTYRMIWTSENFKMYIHTFLFLFLQLYFVKHLVTPHWSKEERVF